MTKERQPPVAVEDLDRESVGFRRRREKRERAIAFLADDPLIVGLDLAKKRHAVWIAKRDLTPIRRFMVEHSPVGLAKLMERAEQDWKAHGLKRVVVFMEATSYFWQNVANVLEAREIPYRTVAPLAVDRQREIEHLTYAKGDYRDAELIARLGAGGQWLDRVLDRDPIWIGPSVFPGAGCGEADGASGRLVPAPPGDGSAGGPAASPEGTDGTFPAVCPTGDAREPGGGAQDTDNAPTITSAVCVCVLP
jgi:hypothetical protein